MKSSNIKYNGWNIFISNDELYLTTKTYSDLHL